MSQREAATEKMAQVLGSFLSAPPSGTPLELIEAFGKVIKVGDGILPPRVFVEAVEQSPVAISITDIKANIIYANEAFQQLTGYPLDELLGRNQSILSYKVTPPEVYKGLWTRLLDKKSWNGVLINKRKDGERYLANLTVSPVLGMDGETSYYLAMHRDVTDVHELERRVTNQKMLIESVVDASPIVTVLLDSSGKVILDNQAYKKLLSDLHSKEPAEIFLSQLRHVIPDIQTACEHRLTFTDEEVRLEIGKDIKLTRWYSCSSVWVNEYLEGAENYFSDTDKQCLLLVAKDITVQKKQQEKIKTNAMRALMAEQRLRESTRETLSGAIYQLQGQLNQISAVLAISDNLGEDNQNDSLINAMRDILHAGENVMAGLRRASPSNETESMINMVFYDVVKDVLELNTKRFLSEGIQIIIDDIDSLPIIRGHQYGLRSLVHHLLDNAIIAVSDPAVKQREISISTKYRKGVLEFSIQDSGRGMAKENRLQVFEPFFSGWGYVQGHAGMGLTLALEEARRHGGSLEIDCDREEGCRVLLAIPVIVDAERSEEIV